ncbi:unnamed protein product [Closterium sp. NIES-53]
MVGPKKMVGVVAGVWASVAAVLEAVGVGVVVVAAVGVVAAAVVAVGEELFRGEVLAVARGSSRSVGARPLRPSTFTALPGTAPPEAVHTFTLDSGASRFFFRNSTTLTPLPAPIPDRLADPSGGPVLARSSTVLPCLVVPSGSLLGIRLPSFSTNLVSASGLVAAPCLCRLLSHQTLQWHHRLGHPSLPCLCGMHSCLLVSGLPRSLPPLPPLPAPPCLPCIEGWQRVAPHSSSFPPTTAPLQTLHMDVKGEVPDVLIPWIRVVCLQLRERFREDLPVLRLHSDRGGEFSSDLLRDIFFMEVARTSMIHAAAPHFLWSFAVRYAAHQLNLWPRVSLPETSPTLRWTGKVGDASVFQVWGSLLPPHLTPCPPLLGRHVRQVGSLLPSLPLPLCPLPPPPIFLAQGPPPVDPLPPQGPAPSGVSWVDPLPGTVPVEVVVDSGAARGAASGGAASGGAELASAEPVGAGPEGAESGGAEPGGAEPGGTRPKGAEPGCAESEGAESGGAEPRGTASAGGPAGASPRLSPRRDSLSPQQLCEWFAQRTCLRIGAVGTGGSPAGSAGSGGTGAGGVGASSPGVAGVTAGARGTGVAGAAGAGGARTRGAESRGAGAGSAGAGNPGAEGAGTGVTGAGGIVQRRQFFDPPLPSSLPPPDSQDSPIPAPSPYAEQTDSLTERREPESCPALPVRAVRTSRLVPCPRPPVPGTHIMALRPFSFPLRVPQPPCPASFLPDVPDPEYDLARATSPPIPRLLATVIIDPSFEPTAASALVAELVDFAAAYRLDYATSLVAESESDCPPFVGGTQRSLRRPVYGLRQAPREWHDTPRTKLGALGFAPSTFLRTDTSLPPFYVLVYVDDFVFAIADTEALALVKSELQKRHTCTDVGPSALRLPVLLATVHSSPQSTPLPTGHSLSAPPLDESVEPSGPYPELVGCLITSGTGLVLGGRGPVVLTGHADASWVDDLATQRSSQGYTFSLGFASVSWRSTRSSSVLSSSCEAKIYARSMAAQELRWLTYLLTDLGEQPRSYPLQQHGQLCLAYVATRANTADIFTKALQSGDHQPRSPPSGSPHATLWQPTRRPFAACAAWLLPTPAAAPAVSHPAGRPSHVPPYLALRAALLVACHPALPTMASLSLLTLDHEGCPIQFDTWIDDLQLYLLSDYRDNVSLFDHTSGASLAPPATADCATRLQWLTRDAAACLAVRNHLPLAERAHFGQQKTAKELYGAVVAHYC